MSDITKLSILELKEKLASKEITSVELTKAYLAKIKKEQYNAFLTICEESALASASESDSRIAAGKARKLEGIPLAIKDNFCTKGVKTTCASKMLENFIPPYESTVTQNLWDEGAVMLGKVNMDQFAMGSANMTSNFGNVINPLKRSSDDKKLVPGGSSGGSATATAANLCAASIGSDTGGSIRQPASFVNAVGVKPTYGRCSRWGTVAFASSLDQAGPITKTVADAALMLDVMSSYDDKDSTSANVENQDFSADLDKGVKGLKIGIPKEYEMEGMDESIIKVWEDSKNALKARGAELVEISLPHTKYAAPTYYIIACAEASSNLARFDGVRYTHREVEEGDTLKDMYMKTRAAAFGEEVRKRIMVGTYVLSSGYYDAYYTKALKVRRLISEDFDKAFKSCDAILTPTTPNAAFGMDEKLTSVQIYHNDVFTVAANLAALPAISIPAGLNQDNLPLGIQVMTPRFTEDLMFQVANSIEKQGLVDKSKLCYH